MKGLFLIIRIVGSRELGIGEEVPTVDEFETFDNYEKMHRLEEEAKRLLRKLEEQERRADAMQKQLTDMEAERFADRCEIDMDLERWDGMYAARVGHDLERVADKLTEAMEANGRGEDVRGILWDAYADVCDIMADISTDADGE